MDNKNLRNRVKELYKIFKYKIKISCLPKLDLIMPTIKKIIDYSLRQYVQIGSSIA